MPKSTAEPAATAKPKPTLTPEEKAARLAAAKDLIAREAASLKTSADWLAWLKMARRFHNYSWGNVLLMSIQASERGMAPLTHVAGFWAWKDLNRAVCKGQTGLTILRPALAKIKPGNPKFDPANPDRKRLVGFVPTKVWDIQQTDGEPLPARPTFTYPSGKVPFGLRTGLIDFGASIGFPVSFGIMPADGVEGYTSHDPSDRKIVIAREHEDNDARAVMVLLHELAHAILHEPAEFDYRNHRGVAETEAESVAFVVGDYFGLTMGEQSFHYVAGWAPDADTVMRTGERILKTSHKIIDAVDADVQHLIDPLPPVAAEPEPVEPEPFVAPGPIGSADKVTMVQARAFFRAGRGIIVTETPKGASIAVFPLTTVNRRSETHTWEALHNNVKEWRNRHPNQTFYVVREDVTAKQPALVG